MVGFVGPAIAGWQFDNSGVGQSRARTVAVAAQPVPVVTGRNVAIEWPAAQLSDAGPAATGYVVRRYSSSGALQTIGAGCGGSVAALSCTESATPPGTWSYTIAALYQGWQGPEGPAATAVVRQPTLALSPDSVPQTALPTSLTGSIGHFLNGESVQFRLDSTTGPVLTGTVAGAATPAPVPSGGAAAVSVQLPAGTSMGAHTIYAIAAPSGEAATDTVSVTVPPPDVTEVVVASHPTKGNGRAKQGGNYFVYANITGTVDTATANVSAITANANTVAMEMCSSQCDVDGTTYNYKSVSPHQTTNGTLAEGTYSFSVTASNGGGSDTAFNNLVIDNTQPTPGALSLVLKNNGAEVGVPENGDTIEVTFSEALAVNTMCSGWTDNSTNKNATVDVTITDGTGGGPDDTIVFTTASCGTFTFGSIAMGGKNFLQGGNMTFTASEALWDVASKKFTVTLRNKGGSASVNQANLTSVYTPNPAIQDLAGNAVTGTAESPAGRQF